MAKRPRPDAVTVKPSLLDTLTEDLVSSLRSGGDFTKVDANRERYRTDPVAYMVEVLRLNRYSLVWSETPGFPATHKWDGTPDPLATILRALAAGKNVGVESATGTGKTVLLAAITCWWLDCWPKSLVVTVAPKEDQLKLNLWKELRDKFYDILKARHPQADMTGGLKLKMNPPGTKWQATGFTAGVGESEEVATKARGFHDLDMLICFEETPGIKLPIMTAFAATCVSPHNLRIAVGNPEHADDTLHQFCQEPGVVPVRISALDHPNVVCNDPMLIPAAVTKQSVDNALLKYGANHNLYLSSVRGISPAQSKDSLIRRDWCDNAVAAGYQLAQELLPEIVDSEGNPCANLDDLLGMPRDKLISMLRVKYSGTPWDSALGVDVANSERGDLGAIARGVGAACLEVEDFPCPDANLLGVRVAIEMREHGIDPDYVGVDSIGVGAGCVNELMSQGFPVQALNAGAGPAWQIGGTEEFANMRAEMHWLARQDLEAGRVILPNDEVLLQDLCTPRWEPRGGKIFVEKKEKLRERLKGKRSPNKGDAWIMWNWARQIRAPGITIGGAEVTF